jgi:plastocyanin
MKTSTVVGIAVVIVVVGIGWYFLSNKAASTTAPTEQAALNTNSGAVSTSTAPMSMTVTYGPNGFSPSSVTIATGGTVTWVAGPGADELWLASNPHPTHEGYDGTTRAQHCATGYKGPQPFDQCSVGTTFSFTFTKVGSWGYHNHGNHSDTGTVIVQ